MSTSMNGFSKTLIDESAAFGNTVESLLRQNYGIAGIHIQTHELQKTIEIQNNFIASIGFVGMVTGEFIISMGRDTALNLFDDENSIRDEVTELMNLIAGARVGVLAKLFDKLTVLPPKVLSGNVRYPKVKNVRMTIRAAGVEIDCVFFIDRMKLEIAESYSEVIHNLQHANQALSEANQKLKIQQSQLVHAEKMSSLGVMAAGIAHEINNPLSFVTSNTEILDSYMQGMTKLLDGYEELMSAFSEGKIDEATSYVGKIRTLRDKGDIDFVLQDTRSIITESRFGLERIRAIVAGLKKFSRTDTENWKDIDLSQEIENTLMLLQNELKQRCRVKKNLLSHSKVHCLPGELGQVFVNLIMNASHAVKEKNGTVEIKTWDEGDHIIIAVCDNGIGIPKENLEKIFDPFFTTKPIGEGTGLGLSISHGIIEKHQGRITVDSEVGTGTEFRVYLPLLKQEPLETQSFNLS